MKTREEKTEEESQEGILKEDEEKDA